MECKFFFNRCTVVCTLLAMIFLIQVSCRKEYVDKYNIVPGDTVTVSGYTDIESFKIKEYSADTPLVATVAHDSIIVYWPSYKQQPDSISPEIVLAAKASIAPLSGKAVAFVKGTTYTVTSEAGIKKTYKLYIDVRQPMPWFSFRNLDFYKGPEMSIGGDWYLPDTGKTRVTFISATTQAEYNVFLLGISPTSLRFSIPQSVPDGLYDIRVINGIHTIYNSDALGRNTANVVTDTYPYLYTLGSPFTVKKGSTFIVRGSNLTNTLSAALIDDANWVVTNDLEVVTVLSDDAVELRIPANLPAGTYKNLFLSTTVDGLNGPGGFNPDITVIVTE